MAIRDQLIKNQLKQKAPVDDSFTDGHVTAKPYRRWMPGFRTFTRLRYLALKKRVLEKNKQSLKYDVTADELQHQVATELDSSTKKHSIWPTLMRPFVMIPMLIVSTAAVAYLGFYLYQSALDRKVFKLEIPKFSDTVYLYRAAHSQDSESEKTKKLHAELQSFQQDIIDHFSETPAIGEKLSPLLDAIQEKEFPPQQFFALVKKLNDELFINRIPYYLSPTVERADCDHLPLTAFIERLFGGSQGTGDICIVYVLLSFHVEEHRYYNAQRHNHLAFFTRRLDEFEIHDNVLGKVHLGDNTAQILLSNIDASSADSTVSVNEGRLQNKLMPEGMADVYGLESIARRLQTRLVNEYSDELKNSWRWKLSRAFNKLRNQEATVLPAATAKLQRRIADVTAFHEVQHLVDQFNDLQEPPWLADTLAEFGASIPLTPQFQNHVLWELSAFFTHLASGEELQGILLNEFTAITLNPMLQDQPHYYSIRILLPVLQAMHEGTLGAAPPAPALTLADVARNYKYLSQQTEQLDIIARDAYQMLFDDELPVIVETNVTSRTVETLEAPLQ